MSRRSRAGPMGMFSVGPRGAESPGEREGGLTESFPLRRVGEKPAQQAGGAGSEEAGLRCGKRRKRRLVRG